MKLVFVLVWIVAALCTWVGIGVFAIAAACLGVAMALGLVLSFLCVVVVKVWRGLTGVVARTASKGWEVLCRGL